MSAFAICSGNPSKRIARPPKRCASPLARSYRRLAMKAGSTPRAARARGGSSPGSSRVRTSGQFRVLTGPHPQHKPARQVAKRPLCELDGYGRHRNPAFGYAGLRARPLARGERAAKEAIENRPRGSLDERELVSALYLALDLGLADDHRVEAGGDAEQMQRGVDGAARVQVGDQLGRWDTGLSGQHAESQRFGAHRVRCGEVELGPVARGDRRGLLDLRGLD